MSDHESDNLFRSGQYDAAVARLKIGLEKQGTDGRDLLLYLLDLGLVLHTAGRYEESNKYFLKANDIAEIKDYTSLTKEGATLLTSDNIKDYKGEDFEKVLINVYLAMNYALMGNTEDALVEARRVNQKLYLMVTQGGRKYQQDPFARYLSAYLYEGDGDLNDAYIDYQNTYKLAPGFPGLCRDLWRLAYAQHMSDETDRWNTECNLTDQDHAYAKMQLPKAGKAELLVIYENGISPIKRPNPSFRELPKFYPRFNPVLYANVLVDGQLVMPTAQLLNIETTAIENLDEKWGGMLAKKLAGLVAKEIVGDEIGNVTHSALLGFAAKVALYASDEADVRSWNLLPKDIQVARFTIEPGTHHVQLQTVGGPWLPERTVTVAPGKKALLDFRFMP